MALQAMVILSGQVMIGAILSVLVMVCAQVDLFPQASVAVQVRVMICVHDVPDIISTNVTTGVA